MTEYLLENMTAKEAEEALKTRKIVVLPVGAIHKHGDWPLGTDIFSCTELARRLGKVIPEKVTYFPPYHMDCLTVVPYQVKLIHLLSQSNK